MQRGVNAGRKVVEALRLVVPMAMEALNRQLDTSISLLMSCSHQRILVKLKCKRMRGRRKRKSLCLTW